MRADQRITIHVHEHEALLWLLRATDNGKKLGATPENVEALETLKNRVCAE